MKNNSLKIKFKGARYINNRRCFSANGFSLLPLALRPRLFFYLLIIAVFAGCGICSTRSAFAANSTISINVAQSTASLNIRSISGNGTFSNSGTDIAFNVTTNNFSGYNLSITASNNGADAANLTQTIVKNAGTENEESTIYRIESLGEVEGVTSGGISESVFSNSSNIQYNNKWGIRPNKLNSVDNNNYLPIPTSTSDGTALDTTSVSGTNNYTINIGARVDASIPTGTYSNTLVITTVANLINYEITYNKGNTEDTVTNLPASTTGVIDDPTSESTNITLPATIPTRLNYSFNGWCTTLPIVKDDGSPDNCGGTTYTAWDIYDLDTTADPDVTLYAMWGPVPNNLTFKVGDNIETVIVADSSQDYKPYYAKPGSDVIFFSPAEGTKYVITVVPEPNYKLSGWARASNVGDLTSTTLLTTTYVAGGFGETFTAKAVRGSYSTMKDFTTADCTVATNVTDSRDGKSYTVAPIKNNNDVYCYMLSNLRLDNTTDGTTQRVLTSLDSDITPNTTYTEFPMPIEDWVSTNQNYYCKAIMKVIGNEYYYNWYAVKANPYECINPTNSANATEINDGYSLGSICPKGWTLPNYSGDLTTNMLRVSSNFGMLMSSGLFVSGNQGSIGSYGYWWSDIRDANNSYAYHLYVYNNYTGRTSNHKNRGFSVRCMRSN